MVKLLFSAVLFCIYLPTAVVGYTFLGDCIQPNMLDSLLDDSAVKLAASVIIILHLYTAAPIAMSAPTLWMEEILNIPSSNQCFLNSHYFLVQNASCFFADLTWRRVLFRTLSMMFLLFIAMSIPTFDSVLALVGGSAIITLTFVLSPIIYLICVDADPSR